jgi:hypothetical protein
MRGAVSEALGLAASSVLDVGCRMVCSSARWFRYAALSGDAERKFIRTERGVKPTVVATTTAKTDTRNV